MLKMTERKKKVLKAIINEYVMTAEPIGSRTLVRRYNFGFSSATIRNEMADLEEMGYLKQPHKSAGRIPSDRGYRFYVDTLMELQKVSKRQQEAIKDNYEYEAKAKEIHEIIYKTSNMLSDLTKYTSLILSPQVKNSVFRSLKLIPLDSKNVLLILITDLGIQDRIVAMPQELSHSELQEMSRFLNERLRGLTLNQINEQLLSDLEHKLLDRLDYFEGNINFLYPDLFNPISSKEKVYLGGTTNILEQPEFNDIQKVKSVLRLLEEEELLYDILGTISGDDNMSGVSITIGQENEIDEIKNCSMVTATYRLNNRAIGKIGVLGPTRMDYSNVVSIVKMMAQVLSSMLTDKNK